MKKISFLICFVLLYSEYSWGQTLTETQMRNARASGYAIVAACNPGKSFSVLMIPWDGINSLEYNANTQINPGWHAQAAVKGNYFYQSFDGSDFSSYSTVILSQGEFDQYKNTGTQWWIVCSTLPPYSCSIFSSNTGAVGVGTTNPDQKLTVKGKIHAEEVIVDLNVPAADYVFAKDYSLMPLHKVEQYVKTNSHLPDVPSATEIKDKGLSMGEMQNKLLQKIEELTLYAIEQNKKMEIQQNEIQALKKEIQTMKK
jgi:hypothetical protein